MANYIISKGNRDVKTKPVCLNADSISLDKDAWITEKVQRKCTSSHYVYSIEVREQ